MGLDTRYTGRIYTFVFGALELFLNHAIMLSMSLWFAGLAAISALGAIGTVHLVLRAREESENAEMLRLFKAHHYLFFLYYVLSAAMALLFAYICFALNLSASSGVQGMRVLLAIVLVLLIAIGLDGSAYVSNRYWRKAVISPVLVICHMREKKYKHNRQAAFPF